MHRTLAVTLALTALGVAPAAAQSTGPTAEIKEWTVPWENSRPRDPFVAPDGRIVFVGQRGNYIARLDPKTGEFKQYTIDAGTNPHNVIVDPSGTAWYAGNRNATIGKLDLTTGAITRYPMPDSTARDPHTMMFDGKGDIWFTMQGSQFVGRLTMASGKVQLVKMPGRYNPYGLVVDPAGRPWFDLFATNKIGTIDPATMALKEFVLPDSARPRRIALTKDGMVWYGDYRRGYTGRLDPKTGQVKEWVNPSGRTSLPYAMAVDDQDRIWFVETGVQPNKLVGFDPKTEKFFSITEIPSGGGAVRHMVYDPKEKVIWFGTDRNTIGKAAIPRTNVTS